MSESVVRVQDEIDAECARAHAKFGPFTSAHEAYGVLAEEMAELLDAVRSNDAESVRREAIQVSAVARRMAECVEVREFRERSGMK